MNTSIIAANFFNPPILFFFLGIVAAFLKVAINIPKPIAKFLSLYLLFSLGFHGGTQLAHGDFTWLVFLPLLVL